VAVGIRNGGHLPIHIPVSPVVSPSSTLWLKVTREGAEEVTYGHQPASFGFEKGWANLIVIPPHSTHVLYAWFVPWAPGKYECIVTLRNTEKVTTRHGYFPNPEGPGMVYRRSDEPIPNVWVGECSFRIFPIEPGFDTVAHENAVKEHLAFPPREEWYVFDLNGQLEKLRESVLSYPGAPLRRATQAIDSLVAMRHVFAVDTLVSLEKETRERLGRGEAYDRELLHHEVVSALRRMVYSGAGYRALPTFVSLALDKGQYTDKRLLCIDVLCSFAHSKAIERDGRVIHVITEVEGAIAREALKKLHEAGRDEPEEVARALRSRGHSR
jgi:hypothetical protein